MITYITVMEANNFKHWLNRRNNKVDEGLLSWLFNRQKLTTNTNKQNSEPIDPEELSRVIYKDPMVQKYTQNLLQHLGVSNGTKVDRINHSNEKIGDWVVNWDENPQFMEALQRFIAGHIIGQGADKSFLRISHHDAIVIINTLSQLRWSGPNNKGLTDIADELHIDNPKSLANWVQTKVPVAGDAMMQQGYGDGSDEFKNSRFVRTGRGDPMTMPAVRKVVGAGTSVVKAWNGRKVPKNLYNALQQLDQALFGVTGKKRTEGDPIRKVSPRKRPQTTNPTNPIDPLDDPGEVGTGSGI